MLVAMGPQGKRIPPLQGTGGFHHRSCGRDAVARWLRGLVRLYFGERCAFLYPIALIMEQTLAGRLVGADRWAVRSGALGDRALPGGFMSQTFIGKMAGTHSFGVRRDCAPRN